MDLRGQSTVSTVTYNPKDVVQGGTRIVTGKVLGVFA